jgi:hypothetical protein
MARIQYHGLPADELLEKMGPATAIYVYYSAEDREEAWSSTQRVPRRSKPRADAQKGGQLELIVDSSPQLAEVQSLWSQVKQGG